MIEIILIIIFFAMIGLATLNWQLCQAIIKENMKEKKGKLFLFGKETSGFGSSLPGIGYTDVL